jgi:hypothetical protein
MTGRRLAAVACSLALLAPVTGCDPSPPRTEARILDDATSLAFKRTYDAAHRMSSDQALEKIIKRASARCRPLSPDPPSGREWPWACEVRYETAYWAGSRVSYLVGVDPRGCFRAVSPDFPPRLHERILNRFSPNPLASFAGCP